MPSPTKSKRTAKFYRGTRSRSQRIIQQTKKKAEEIVKNLNEDKYPTISQRKTRIELLEQNAKKIGHEVVKEMVEGKAHYYIKKIRPTSVGTWQGTAAKNLRNSRKFLSAINSEP